VQHLGPGLPWDILEQPAGLAVDGVDYGAEDALDRALARGGVVQVPEGGRSLVVAVERTLVMEITPGSTVELPSPTAGRDPLHLRVDQGEVRALTGPDFQGRRLTVATPDGLVEVTGTIFSVACNQDGTCVCVLEGKLQVGADRADLQPVPAGKRKVMFRDGSPAKITDAAPPHIQGLETFRGVWAGAVRSRP